MFRVLMLSFLGLICLAKISLASPLGPKNSCLKFDQIALQLALAHNTMQAPLSLADISRALGPAMKQSSFPVTAYSWTHKNRLLLVTVKDQRLVDKLLVGTDDGSLISKKMEQLYSELKGATSSWSIHPIQKQLGPGYVISKQLYSYSWDCDNNSTLTITTNKENTLIAATISYQASAAVIAARVGPASPTWDTKVDSLNQTTCMWQRSFAAE